MLQSYTPVDVVATHRDMNARMCTSETVTESGLGVGWIARAEARGRFIPTPVQPAARAMIETTTLTRI